MTAMMSVVSLLFSDVLVCLLELLECLSLRDTDRLLVPLLRREKDLLCDDEKSLSLMSES
jgi:hypothetical protein